MRRRHVLRTIKWAMILFSVSAVTLLGIRAYDSQRGPPLELWHTYVPHELNASELDQANWSDYMKAESTIFDSVRQEVTSKIGPKEHDAFNRYFEGSLIYPGHFAQDWNRSYVLVPASTRVGAAVFLHGLTDSPYSLHHIAERYREAGYVSIVIRLPGHGTVPGALTDIRWEQWLAATQLAVREARRLVGPKLPLHLIGYSNGGALATMYALDSLYNKQLARPDRIILISPMIGVTRFARFASLAGLPALLPAFAKAAWLSLLPEFNPFKYNSFPVNAARQSYRLTQALQQKLRRYTETDRLADLPPIITFQSVLDSTVSTRAVVSDLYARLPANGSELVLFDVNQNAKIELLRPASKIMVARLLPDPPRRFRTTIVANASPNESEVVERVIEAGARSEWYRPLGLSYPANVYSLSHVALPFPMSDALYGLRPDSAEHFGIELGSIVARGERGALIISPDFLFRMLSNPFYPYMIRRIEDLITSKAEPQPARLPWPNTAIVTDHVAGLSEVDATFDDDEFSWDPSP